MDAEKNPVDVVRSMMLDNLEKVGNATKGYLDLMQKSMMSMPNANENQVSGFRQYLERQVAANHAFVNKLLNAKDFQEAVQIQVEYFQSQMRGAVNEAVQLGEIIAKSTKPAA